jgi:hypothetical protein
MTLNTLLTQHPDVFWALIYFCWGGAYAAITISTGAVVLLTQYWKTKFPKRRGLLFFCQLVWALTHLGGVFLVPWLLGAFAIDELRQSRFAPLWLTTWFLGVAAIYLLVRPAWGTLSEMLGRESSKSSPSMKERQP